MHSPAGEVGERSRGLSQPSGEVTGFHGYAIELGSPGAASADPKHRTPGHDSGIWLGVQAVRRGISGHPWISLAIGLVCGFVAGMVVASLAHWR
jgi:hypothetical protein